MTRWGYKQSKSGIKSSLYFCSNLLCASNYGRRRRGLTQRKMAVLCTSWYRRDFPFVCVHPFCFSRFTPQWQRIVHCKRPALLHGSPTSQHPSLTHHPPPTHLRLQGTHWSAVFITSANQHQHRSTAPFRMGAAPVIMSHVCLSLPPLA